MPVDDGNRVSDHGLGQGGAVAVQMQLCEMVAQLIEQAFAQVATGNARRVKLADNLQRFVQIGDGEVYRRNVGRRRGRARRSHVRRSGGVGAAVRRAGRRNFDGLDLAV